MGDISYDRRQLYIDQQPSSRSQPVIGTKIGRSVFFNKRKRIHFSGLFQGDIYRTLTLFSY